MNLRTVRALRLTRKLTSEQVEGENQMAQQTNNKGDQSVDEGLAQALIANRQAHHRLPGLE